VQLVSVVVKMCVVFFECLYRMGGILPSVARDLHKKHVEKIVNLALERASLSVAVEFELAVHIIVYS